MRFCIDCEFNEYKGQLISMALVPEQGQEFYESIGCEDPGDWVKANVIPIINKDPISIDEFQKKLEKYLSGYFSIQIIADWPEDIQYFCEALITGPGTRIDTPSLSFMIMRIEADSDLPHNALEDARGIARKVFGG